MHLPSLALPLLVYVTAALASPSNPHGLERRDVHNVAVSKPSAAIVKRNIWDWIFRRRPKGKGKKIYVAQEIEMREFMVDNFDGFKHELARELDECRNRKVTQAREDYFHEQGRDVPKEDLPVHYAVAEESCRKELGLSREQYRRLLELRASWPGSPGGQGHGMGGGPMNEGKNDRGDSSGDTLPFSKLSPEEAGKIPGTVLESAKQYLLPNTKPNANPGLNGDPNSKPRLRPQPLIPKGVIGH